MREVKWSSWFRSSASSLLKPPRIWLRAKRCWPAEVEAIKSATASAGDKGLQDLLLDIRRAVAGDFHRIFPRERMGGTENSGDHLIYGFVIVTDDGTIR